MNRYENLSVGNLNVEMITGGGGFLNQFPGKKIYLDPTLGSDGNTGLSPSQAKKSFTAAYTLLTTNKNDCLVIIGGASALSQTAAITWDKSYTHIFGVGTGTPTNRCRFTMGAAIATWWTFSGNGCLVSDLYFYQGYDSSGHVSHVVMELTGARNRFTRVHLGSGGNATLAALTTTKALLLTNAYGNVFDDSWLGYVDQQITAASSPLTIAGTSKSNLFKNCHEWLSVGTGGTAATFWNVTGQQGINAFENCDFINSGVPSGGLAIDPAFDIVAASGGLVLLKDAAVYTGTADCDLGDADTVTQLIVSGAPSTAALSGRAFAASVTS